MPSYRLTKGRPAGRGFGMRGGIASRRAVAAVAAAAAVACPAGAYVLEGQSWADQNPATPGTIDIFYDFRNIGAFTNDLTLNNATATAEKALFVQTLNDWSAATGGKIVFTQNTVVSNVINLGLGDMAAVGGSSGRTGVFGLGGGSFGGDNKYVSGFAWLNHAYSFDTTIGNGNVATADADFYSIALHEVGHALGLGHSESSPSNIMTSVDDGEKLRPSVDDNNGIRFIYGSNGSDSANDLAVTRTISGSVLMGNNGFYNFFGSTAASFRYYVDTGTTTVTGGTQINFGGFEHQGGSWTHNSIQIGDPSNSIWSGNPYYSLSGGSLVVNNAVTVGGGAEGGVFLQSGGSASLGSLTIGNASISGTATISGGTLAISGTTTLNTNGRFNVTGGTTTAHALTGSGLVTVGGGTAAGNLSVSSVALSSTLTINNNGTFAIRAATNRITNTLTGLSISGNGTLDIGSHDLVLNGTYTSVNALVKQAAGSPSGTSGLNPWTGSGITSSLVRADAAGGHPNRAAVGFKDNADYVASGNSGKAVAAGKVLVSYAAYGDANLDNVVDIADLSIWNNNFSVGNHWGQGDFNYDGVVDIADLSVWNNNFAGKVTPAPGASSPRTTFVASSKTLSGSTAVGAPVAPATPPVNTLELDIDATTGDATINSGGVSIAAVEIDSAAKDLITANWKSFKNFYHVSGWSFTKGVPNTAVVAEFTSDASSSGTPIALAQGSLTDYGNIVPVGFSNQSDLTFKYNIVLDAAGNTQSKIGNVVITGGVPEPASLGLVVLSGAGLLRRRRPRRRPG